MPQVSPLLATDTALQALPPTMVVTAEFDLLRDEGEEFVRRVQGLHGDVTLVRVPGYVNPPPPPLCQHAAYCCQDSCCRLTHHASQNRKGFLLLYEGVFE